MTVLAIFNGFGGLGEHFALLLLVLEDTRLRGDRGGFGGYGSFGHGRHPA